MVAQSLACVEDSASRSTIRATHDDVASIDSLSADGHTGAGLVYNLTLDELHAELLEARRLHGVVS